MQVILVELKTNGNAQAVPSKVMIAPLINPEPVMVTLEKPSIGPAFDKMLIMVGGP